MLLAYVDESYVPALYWLAALVCEENTLNPLTAALDEVVAKAARSYRTSSTAELHGHALFHGKDDWVTLATMPRARIGIYADALDAIAGFPVEIWIRGVDRVRLHERYVRPDHPHAVVLSHLLERLDERAEQRNELVLVIADQVHQEDTYRKSLWHFQRYSTTGYRPRTLTRIVDTIHFAPSVASRLVQAADLVAFLHCRIEARLDTDERAKRANAALWARIEPRVIHSHCWWP